MDSIVQKLFLISLLKNLTFQNLEISNQKYLKPLAKLTANNRNTTGKKATKVDEKGTGESF